MLANRTMMSSGQSGYFLGSVLGEYAVYKSYDAINWERLPVSGTSYGISLAHGNKDIWLAASSTSPSYFYTSSNGGTTWTYRGTGAVDSLQYRKDLGLWMVCDDEYVMTSSDGINWNRKKVVVSGDWVGGVACNIDGSKMVAFGTDGLGGYSTDRGITWTSRSLGASYVIQAVAYGNGYFFAGGFYGGNGNNLGRAYSNDGVNWTTAYVNGGMEILNIVFGNGIFVAGCYDGKVYTSANGVTITDRGKPLDGSSSNVYVRCYANGNFIANSNNKVYFSPNGITWTGYTPNYPVYDINYVDI